MTQANAQVSQALGLGNADITAEPIPTNSTRFNGANGVLFNHDPDVTHLHRMMQGVRTGGVAYALPTFITAEQAEYVQAMQACEAAQEAVPTDCRLNPRARSSPSSLLRHG